VHTKTKFLPFVRVINLGKKLASVLTMARTPTTLIDYAVKILATKDADEKVTIYWVSGCES
jgi:hypothetical protein